MKLFTILALLLFLSCQNSNIKNAQINNTTKKTIQKINNSPAKIKFETETHDFGTLQQGEKVEYNFYFKNIGGKELKITEVDASCGCTIAEYDKIAIKFNEKSKIKIIFDSYGFRNNQYKTIKVKTNSNQEIELIIAAFVEVKDF